MLDHIDDKTPGVYRNLEAQAKKMLLPHFDHEFYCDRYRDINTVSVDPLEHYIVFGWREGRDPCGWFSTRRYMARNLDVAESDVNPFLHYVVLGKDQGRQIWPADHTGPFDLAVDPTTTFVSDANLRNLVMLPSCNLNRVPTPLLLDRLKIHWVIPDFNVGSGGHMTIFRLIRWLEIAGHDCAVWITNPDWHKGAGSAYEDVVKHFQTIRAPVAFVEDGLEHAEGDAVIATGWQTVAHVLNATGFRERFYLVQDYEPSFHSMGSHALAAEWTYTQDLSCICASPWLAEIMRKKYGRWASPFWLAYDRTVYHLSTRSKECAASADNGAPVNPPRIALYARLASPRRAVELALLALECLAAKGIEFHVDLFGEDVAETRAPFSCSVHGVLDAEGLADLYRKADIGICFSSTNYSLIPQEMMACGLPVVELDGESTRAVFPKDVVTLTGPHPQAIADDVEALLRDPKRRQRQVEAACRWVGQFDWEKSAGLVEGALLEKLRPHDKNAAAFKGKPRKRLATPRTRFSVSTEASCKASVCIPTYNGGELLAKVMERVRAQRTPWPFEIIIVDSGSTDGSFESLKSQKVPRASLAAPLLRVKQIPKLEFQHGRTRNLCAAMAQGEFVAFLTQDASPVDEFWLYNLVTVLERFSNAAGAFGRHVPWPTSTSFTRRDIKKHFDDLLRHPLVLSRDARIAGLEGNEDALRQYLHYFSDNNSCLRKSVWQQIPYPEIEYGEDQVWADRIIRGGYEKVYVPTASVYHSHDYTLAETAERAEVESFFFATVFSYKTYDFTRTFQSQLADIDGADLRWARENRVSEQELAHRLIENKARLYGRVKGMERAR